MKVTAVATTQALVSDPALGRPLNGDELIVWMARASSPENQTKHLTGPKLLAFCINERHWSVFDMADFTVEVETSVAISLQIVRHWSFRFQQFSQRYADVRKLEFTGAVVEPVILRKKAAGGNRQGSGDPVSTNDHRQIKFDNCVNHALATYIELIEDGIAPESARFCLPQCTRTRLYMKGSVRSWIHYLAVREDSHAQLEHQAVAHEIRKVFRELYPNVAGAMELT